MLIFTKTISAKGTNHNAPNYIYDLFHNIWNILQQND